MRIHLIYTPIQKSLKLQCRDPISNPSLKECYRSISSKKRVKAIQVPLLVSSPNLQRYLRITRNKEIRWGDSINSLNVWCLNKYIYKPKLWKSAYPKYVSYAHQFNISDQRLTTVCSKLSWYTANSFKGTILLVPES